MLGSRQDAEDAAQAVFLVLAKTARRLVWRESVAGWLHRVAVCTAHNAYRTKKRRQAREEEAAKTMIEEQSRREGDQATIAALHTALADLPEKYRLPLVLHYLEGKSYDEAAGQIGCGESALAMRLARGRELLRSRLARRGLALSVTAMAGLLAKEAVAVGISEAFVAATVKMACGWAVAGSAVTGAAVVPAQVAELTKGVLNMMFWSQVKVAAVVVAGVAVIGGGGVAATRLALGENPRLPKVTAEKPVIKEQVNDPSETEAINGLRLTLATNAGLAAGWTCQVAMLMCPDCSRTEFPNKMRNCDNCQHCFTAGMFCESCSIRLGRCYRCGKQMPGYTLRWENAGKDPLVLIRGLYRDFEQHRVFCKSQDGVVAPQNKANFAVGDKLPET
jgi:RNA polymerase sigma factor (sigma-70 family)